MTTRLKATIWVFLIPVSKLKVHITNDGLADLEVSALNVTGMDAEQWQVKSETTPFTVQPGDTSELTLCFVPTTESAKNAALQISSNDSDENPSEVALSGTGVTMTSPVAEKIEISFAENNKATFSGITSDALIYKAKPDFNTGANKFLRVGNNGLLEDKPFRTLLKFDFFSGLAAASAR